MDTAVKGVTGFHVDVGVLLVWGNVAYDIYFRKTGSTIEVAARQSHRIAVQIHKHISVFEGTPKFFKYEHILAIVIIKRMFVISNPITRSISILLHHTPCLAGAGLAEYVGHLQVAPLIGEVLVTVDGPGALNIFNAPIGGRDHIDNFIIRFAVTDHIHDSVSGGAFSGAVHGTGAGFIERVAEIGADMEFALFVSVVVSAGLRVFVELWAVFEDIGPVFGGAAIAVIPMHFRKKCIYLKIGKGRVAIDENVRMPGLALITFFITHTPVERIATDIGHDAYDFLMGISVLFRIVYGHHPFPGLSNVFCHCISSPLKYTKYKIQKRGGNTDPPSRSRSGARVQRQLRGRGARASKGI